MGCYHPRVPHLILCQELASPVIVRDVVDRQAQVVVAVFEQQRLGILQQDATQTPLQIQHLLLKGRRGGGGRGRYRERGDRAQGVIHLISCAISPAPSIQNMPFNDT